MTKKVYIIAEVGNNHEGDFDVAKKMIDKAAETGVDAIKFQTFKTEHFINPENPERFNKLKSFELTYDQFTALSEHTKKTGLDFISTPFDIDSVLFLKDIVSSFKIASSDVNLYPLIAEIAKSSVDIILSTGTADMTLLKSTKKIIQDIWSSNSVSPHLTFLHCITSYPVLPEFANLNAITAMQKELQIDIGYSDHTIGNVAATIATTLGATVIEKHFTLDHNYSDFRDHQLSCEPDEMKALVKNVRETEKMLGEVNKEVSQCEHDIIPAVRRSIAAKNDLQTGYSIKENDLIWTRPSGGMEPGTENMILGKKLLKNIKQGEPFTLEHFSNS
jgi:N,N'-diacetyllegionaminate synthase